MVIIYLIRHGETDYNEEERMLGRLDVPINNAGIENAKKLAPLFESTKLKSIYSSPLSRCIRTAEEISKKQNIKVVIIPELIEHSKGRWDGLTKTEIMENDPVRHKQFLAGEDPKIEGGETFKEVEGRIKPFINLLISSHKPDEEVLVVAHGGINRVFIGTLLGMPVSEMYALKQDNCCVNVIHAKKDGSCIAQINLTYPEDIIENQFCGEKYETP